MIEIKNVSKIYEAGEIKVQALNGVSLNIEQGEFIALAGPSGSGKTTLLNIIGCIDKADSGTVTISGRTVMNLKRDEQAVFRRDNLGFVFQSYNLIPVLTAFENVAFGLKLQGVNDREARDRTMAILEEVGLKGMENRLPAKLSGGQQQRVAVARAIVKNPEILLADEPTANLDSSTSQDILDLMKQLNKKHNGTFLFSTHDPMVMEFSERLVLLKDGRIHEDKKK